MVLPPSEDALASPVAGSTVLIVDDHEASVRAWIRVLERFHVRGIGVATISGARDVIDREGGLLDAVLLDYVLPDGDASEVPKALRQRCLDPALVLATGIEEEIAYSAARRLGMDRLILKPVESGALVDALGAALAARRERGLIRVAVKQHDAPSPAIIARHVRRGRPAGLRLRAELIVARRLAQGWTQAALADQARITIRTLSQAEKGRRVSVSTAVAIAKALDTSLDQLVVGVRVQRER